MGGQSRQEWLAERQGVIGSSDAPQIMGVSPWGGPLSVYVSKTKELTPAPEDGPGLEKEILYWGHALEEPIAQRYALITGRRVENPGSTLVQRHPQYPFIGATVDRWTWDEDGVQGILEIKTTRQEKGEDWEETVPAHYQVQVQHQMAVTGKPWAVVACLIGGQKMVHHLIKGDPGFQRLIVEEEVRFWNENVLAGVPPPADSSRGSSEAIDELYPEETEGTLVAGDDVIDAFNTLTMAKEKIKELEDICKGAENRIKMAMGECVSCNLPGGYWITWKTQHRKAFQVEAASFRAFRINKPRKG